MSKEEISLMIKTFRKKAGMTQEMLAEASGTNLATIRAIEQARGNTKQDTLDKIAEALGLKLTLVLK